METSREKVVDLCKRLCIPLNETYAKTFKYKTIKLWKYKEDSKARQRRKIMISLKVRLGRLIRICQRGIEKSKLELMQIKDKINELNDIEGPIVFLNGFKGFVKSVLKYIFKSRLNDGQIENLSNERNK